MMRTRRTSFTYIRPACRAVVALLVTVIMLCGCQAVREDQPLAEPPQQRTFVLAGTSVERARTILSRLNLGVRLSSSEPNTVVVDGAPSDVRKAGVVLGLIDSHDVFVVASLAPAALAWTLPTNDQIARAVGRITIGTFAVPPAPGPGARAIIDIQGDSVVAIVPAQFEPKIRAVAELCLGTAGQPPKSALQPPPAVIPAPSHIPPRSESSASCISDEEEMLGWASTPVCVPPTDGLTSKAESDATSETGPLYGPRDQEPSRPTRASEVRDPGPPEAAVTVPAPRPPEPASGVLKSTRIDRSATARSVTLAPVSLPNGDEVLELSLPEKIELLQLLDLAGEYLHLDCVYDADKIGNQIITLKLHSKIRSEMRVQDLYSLLETVLKFKGLAMIRQEGNLVTIVPATEALDLDPELIDPNTGAIQAGDIVVTRLFELQYVDPTSMTNLLQNMHLSVAAAPVPETQALFVTGYAHRMGRIEQLVDMVDRPGPPKEFRFRQLKYTAVTGLVQKVPTLAEELEGIAVNVRAAETAPAGAAPSSPRSTPESPNPKAANRPWVYLDTDTRTNRILMIGIGQQLDALEGLIDRLDVPTQDLRKMQVYAIRHVDAGAVLEKLEKLGVVTEAARTSARLPRPPGAAATPEGTPGEMAQVVLLEATNSLLVNATEEQHAQVQAIIRYTDVLPQDTRTLKIYTLQHMDVEDVVRKLQQLNVIGPVDSSAPGASRISASSSPSSAESAGAAQIAPVLMPQVAVLEVTNSLLISATEEQHARIRAIIQYTDVEAPREAVPYEIYFLENQDPEQLAGVLSKLIQETITNAEGKVEKTVPRTKEPITIIPDKNTFSLIVHASRKNQAWIAGLIEKLDRRRPQVLIDVTLVEITQSEAFAYDLNLVQSVPDLTATSGLAGTVVPGQTPVTSADILEKLNASGRTQFADSQSLGGQYRAFYGDKHIDLLLEAMRSKNYGRVLAKPKILVNDNEAGSIKTADTTYVAKQSSVPVSSGGAGTNATLIVTAVDFQSYEAGISLNITPHISQGNLLRLDIELTRSDFRETQDAEKPPDTTSSELKTTVFVPDGNTIILGGLLKLNQNKGGTKVPILGDIPLIGMLFRSVNNKDLQNKLYVFVKAEIIRPTGAGAQGMEELTVISDRDRQAFEKHEQEFQDYQSWPGVKSKPIEPAKVLEAR